VEGAVELEHRDVVTNGIRLHTVTAGPEDGPMVLLLHGFPEAWFGWRRQIPALVERGWFVVAPDQRGYNTSDKPRRTRDYRIERLVDDALGLIDAFGRERACVVGHDWGGMVGWFLALDHAHRVERFCAMNLPHPRVLARSLLGGRQLLRFWYTVAMQVPGLPERALSLGDHERLVRSLYANSTHRAFTPEQIEEYRRSWRQPGAIRATVAWYRAMFRHPRLPRGERVTRPTLIVWGKQDKALGFELVEPSRALCDDVELVVIDDAGHFVQHDAPDRVNDALLRFLAV
jgi:epoxide hydrolase 4